MIELACNRVRFFSSQDETAFFSWAEAIRAVQMVSGRGPAIILTIQRRQVSDRSLVELIALFQRYRVPMRQLAQFLTPKNQAWFADKGAFWFSATFGHHPNMPLQPTRAAGSSGSGSRRVAAREAERQRSA